VSQEPTFREGYEAGVRAERERMMVEIKDLIESVRWIQKKSAHMKSDHAGEINQEATKAIFKFEESVK